jgi:hypothetical protein
MSNQQLVIQLTAGRGYLAEQPVAAPLQVPNEANTNGRPASTGRSSGGSPASGAPQRPDRPKRRRRMAARQIEPGHDLVELGEG